MTTSRLSAIARLPDTCEYGESDEEKEKQLQAFISSLELMETHCQGRFSPQASLLAYSYSKQPAKGTNGVRGPIGSFSTFLISVMCRLVQMKLWRLKVRTSYGVGCRIRDLPRCQVDLTHGSFTCIASMQKHKHVRSDGPI